MVKFRHSHQLLSRYVFVQDAVDERRNGGEEQVEEDQNPGVGHNAPRETTEELIPKQQVYIHLKDKAKLFDISFKDFFSFSFVIGSRWILDILQ